jgi:hypothetical protein
MTVTASSAMGNIPPYHSLADHCDMEEHPMSSLYNEGAPTFSGDRSKSTLTAFFDDRSSAEAAIDRLRQSGVTDIGLTPGYEADGVKADVAADDRGGFWSRLEDWLFPDDDRTIYAEGLRRGGFLVSASVDDANYDAAHDILDEGGAVDMEERADLWRTDGWSAPGGQQAAGSRDDIFQAGSAAGAATGVGRFSRSPDPTSPRVRSYELSEDLPPDIVDDVLPTDHQHDVDEANRRVDEGLSQSQQLDNLRQKQSFPGGR